MKNWPAKYKKPAYPGGSFAGDWLRETVNPTSIGNQKIAGVLDKISGAPVAAVENAAQGLSNLAGQITGGMASPILALGSFNPQEVAEKRAKIVDAMTYKPQTKVGEELSAAVSKPLSDLGQSVKEVLQYAGLPEDIAGAGVEILFLLGAHKTIGGAANKFIGDAVKSGKPVDIGLFKRAVETSKVATPEMKAVAAKLPNRGKIRVDGEALANEWKRTWDEGPELPSKLPQPERVKSVEDMPNLAQGAPRTGDLKAPLPETTPKKPWEMTRQEFEDSHIFRGVGPDTASSNASWGSLPVAQTFAGRIRNAETREAGNALRELRVASKESVPQDALWVGDEIIPVSEQLRREGQIVGPERGAGSIVPEFVVRDADVANPHKALVRDAIKRGDNVPANVLADYPDLAKLSDRQTAGQSFTDKGISRKSPDKLTAGERDYVSRRAEEIVGKLERGEKLTPAEDSILSLSEKTQKIAPSEAAARKPWNMTREEFIKSPPAGFAYDPNITHDANAHGRGGVITVGNKFFDLPPAARENVVWHERGHAISDSMLRDGSAFDLADRGAFGKKRPDGTIEGINGQYTPGENVAEAYALYHTEPDFLREKYPLAYDAIKKRVSGATARKKPGMDSLLEEMAQNRAKDDATRKGIEAKLKAGQPLTGGEKRWLAEDQEIALWAAKQNRKKK